MDKKIEFLFNGRTKSDTTIGHEVGQAPITFPTTDVIFVDPAGNDLTGDGTELLPFQTIYRALEESESNIIAKDGNYGYFHTLNLQGKNLYCEPLARFHRIDPEQYGVSAESWVHQQSTVGNLGMIAVHKETGVSANGEFLIEFRRGTIDQITLAPTDNARLAANNNTVVIARGAEEDTGIDKSLNNKDCHLVVEWVF